MDVISAVLCSCFLLINAAVSNKIDSIDTTQVLRDGDTMVSEGGSFCLGFFRAGSSKYRYLGIWYNKVTVLTVVWVANRVTPLTDTSGILRVTSQSGLVLFDRNISIWSSSLSASASFPVAQLLDSGNLVLKDEANNNPQNVLWQSFDNPGNTLLAGMKLGRDRKTGLNLYLSSWKTPTDPSPGNFTYGFDTAGYPELLLKENSIIKYRPGPWNGLRFSGTPQLKPNPIYTYEYENDEKDVSYSYQLLNSSLPSMVNLSVDGSIQRYTWIDRTGEWELYRNSQIDRCDEYALCGAYGSCNIDNSPICGCLTGFTPNISREWDNLDWNSGCVRKNPLNCYGDGFLNYSGIKLPDTGRSWYNRSMSLEECNSKCLRDCSCTAYSNLNISGERSGCLLWFGDLLDMRQLGEDGQDIYVRMTASDIGGSGNGETNTKSNHMKILLSSALLSLLGLALVLYAWKKKRQKDGASLGLQERNSKMEDLELPLFDLGTINFATNHFSANNKLGEGGFGPVYKGRMKDGQEVAVKRLSRNSTQGLTEFMNEIMHIAKLQHRNLVKILGCCIEANEKMLIYEYMPNKSLDFIIFDQEQSRLLDWPKRYNIINGIARGLLYLHQDSRLRIIHRDLKAGNILLDSEMNPKISDFGLARSFTGNENEANTNKVAGTYGYMSPEYAVAGLYSVKSDVFSFGVMVLEIVSGKRNRGFYDSQHHLNLLGHAWRLHIEGRSSEIIAESLRDTCDRSEALRSIHIGLLCVQRDPDDRPSMSSVVLMLGGEGVLPQPKEPGFFCGRDVTAFNTTPSNHKPCCSANELSLTAIVAR